MALFNVSVLVTLRLTREESQAIQKMAGALEAIVAKLNEPEPPEVDAALHAAIGETAQTAQDVEAVLTNAPSTQQP
jgi:hypothetical protein